MYNLYMQRRPRVEPIHIILYRVLTTTIAVIRLK